jgi:hypothetical protein
MNIQAALEEIWSQDYIAALPYWVKERGFSYSENFMAKNVLISGFNPSFRSSDNVDNHSFDFQRILGDDKWDNYWGSLKKIIHDPLSNIDLRSQTAYLDIFYFREMTQSLFKNEILKSKEGIQFAVDQLKLTQYVIESIIKPKIIIVKNRESAAYWGRYADNGIIWMGYHLDYVRNLSCGDVYKIIGLIDSSERILPEIHETNLIDSKILFTHHINQYTPKIKRPTAVLINQLID